MKDNNFTTTKFITLKDIWEEKYTKRIFELFWINQVNKELEKQFLEIEFLLNNNVSEVVINFSEILKLLLNRFEHHLGMELIEKDWFDWEEELEIAQMFWCHTAKELLTLPYNKLHEGINLYNLSLDLISWEFWGKIYNNHLFVRGDLENIILFLLYVHNNWELKAELMQFENYLHKEFFKDIKFQDDNKLIEVNLKEGLNLLNKNIPIFLINKNIYNNLLLKTDFQEDFFIKLIEDYFTNKEFKIYQNFFYNYICKK